MPRQTARSIAVDTNVRCLRVYPIESNEKGVRQLKTVGIKLSQEQAIHLARVLMAVSQEWKSIDITAHRFDRRRVDGTYHVTVTSFRTDG